MGGVNLFRDNMQHRECSLEEQLGRRGWKEVNDGGDEKLEQVCHEFEASLGYMILFLNQRNIDEAGQ